MMHSNDRVGGVARAFRRAGACFVAAFALLGATGAETPDAYVEYLQSDGTQWVYLDGYKPTPQEDIIVEVEFTDLSANAAIFCSRGDSYSSISFSLFHIPADGLRLDYNTSGPKTQVLTKNQKYKIECDANVLKLDGNTICTRDPATFEPKYNTALFASYAGNPAGTSPGLGNYAKMKLYSFKAYRGGVLQIGLYPCLKGGKPGLYDVVSKKIFYDAAKSKTAFGYGPEVDPPEGEIANFITVCGTPVEYGTPSPAYGKYDNLVAGTEYTFTCPVGYTNEEAKIYAKCAGWTLALTNGTTTSGSGCTKSITYSPEMALAKLTWVWDKEKLTCTWIGEGSDAKASTAANWSGNRPPLVGDDVVFNDGNAPCTWDLDVKLGSWTQDGYTGTVTIATYYDTTKFDCLEIAGDCKVLTGKWTHPKNSGLNRTYRLYVSVGGNMEIGADATIHATGAGYQRQYLLNGGKDVTEQYRGGTYGGFGGWNTASQHPTAYGTVPYGSITAPEDPGSGINGSGGGAIRIDITGAVTHNGVISANSTIVPYYGGSGGSVYLRAGSITGAGTIDANSLISKYADYSSGSGGRIAVILTGSGADFSAYDALDLCTARPVHETGAAQTLTGAPGTIYLETPADEAGKGWLVFKDGGNMSHTARNLCNGWPFASGETTNVQFSRITVTNGASIAVMPGYTLDLSKSEFVTAGSAAVRNGLRLEGGEVSFANATPAIDYWLYSRTDAFDGLKGTDFTLVSPGRIDFDSVDATLHGDWTVDEGATIAAGAPATAADHITVNFSGDLTLNGTINSSAGTYNSDPKYLAVNVAGDFTIGETGLVDMKGCGYAKQRDRTGNRPTYRAGSHGGWGLNWNDTETLTSVVPYGSICNPMTAGGGGDYSAGGGILVVTVGGLLQNDGNIRADSAQDSAYYKGAPGSVNITTSQISGSGRITADANESEYHTSSGGGRVAIRLTKDDADFSGYTGRISAAGEYASYNNGKMGGAGTVFLKTAAQSEDAGTLVVENWDNKNKITKYGWTIIGGDVEGNTFGDVLIGNKAKFVLYGDATLNVGGVLSNGCLFAAQTGSTVNFTGAGESRVYGNFDFYNVSATAPGKTITFDDGATITINGEAALSGSIENNLTLMSATDGQAWTLKGANITLNGVALRDCHSESPITVMNGTDLHGNSENITFVNVQPGEIVTWKGTTDAAWGNAANWDRNRTPIATDKIVIPAMTVNAPVLAGDATVAELTIAEGGVLDIGNKTLTVTGPVANSGTIASADGTLVALGDVTLGVVGAKTLSVKLNGTAAQTLTLADAQLKTLTIANPAVTIAGDLVCTTFTAGDGATAYDVAFAEGASIEAETFNFLGDAESKNGKLRCETTGKQWLLNVAVANVTGATVSGSDASAGVLIVPTACVDGGDNENWLFEDNRAHWLGTTSSDFATAANWSTGEVPDANTDVVIDTANPVVVSAEAAVKSLALDPGATMTVDAKLAVGGSVVIGNGATLTWNVPGTIGGNLAMLKGATLTHGANSTTEAYKIDLAVGGSVSIAAGAKVDVKGKGYTKNKGPGANVGAPFGAPASHGGRCGPMLSYGSVLCPTNCGSGGRYSGSYTYAGGGAVKIVAEGSMTINGPIDASAAMAEYYTGSGGSVWLSASTIAGSGAIRVNGGNGYNYGFGAGGRIALYETVANDFDAFTGAVEAYSGTKCETGEVLAGDAGNSPGTIYRETARQIGGHGTVTIANRPGAAKPWTPECYMVDLPVSQFGVSNELENVDINLGEYGVMALSDNLKIHDITITGGITAEQWSGLGVTNLQLKAHVLVPQVKEHKVGVNDAKQIDYGDGGYINWVVWPTLFLIK